MGGQAHGLVTETLRLEPLDAVGSGLCANQRRRRAGFELEPGEQWSQRRREFGQRCGRRQLIITIPPFTITMASASTCDISPLVLCMTLAS